ncbi:MAG: GNAT family N-acetyltransferase [Spirochaetota bacterium]
MRNAILVTDRLIIRDLPPAAGERVARVHTENWHFHRQWEPHRPQAYFTASVQRRILRAERRSDSMLHLWLLLRDEHGPGSSPRASWRRLPIIGSVTLSSIGMGFFRNAFLGYKMDARYTRRGYMREALLAVLELAFLDLGLHRVEANVMPRNAASLGLVGGVGFREEGLARAYLQIQGRWEDHVHMVMLREEWKAAGQAIRPGGLVRKKVPRP